MLLRMGISWDLKNADWDSVGLEVGANSVFPAALGDAAAAPSLLDHTLSDRW